MSSPSRGFLGGLWVEDGYCEKMALPSHYFLYYLIERPISLPVVLKHDLWVEDDVSATCLPLPVFPIPFES